MLFTELKQSLKDGVAGAYLAQGSDVFLINKSIELILGAAGVGANCVVRMDEDVKPDAIGAVLGNVSMFGDKTAVVVRGLDFAKVYMQPIKSDKEFVKVDCAPMVESMVVKLIMQNKKFGFDAAMALARMCENIYANVDNELRKLDAFYADKAAITVEDIEAIVTKTEKYQVFELGNALLKRDSEKVAVIVENLAQYGIEDYAVFGNLVSFCRRMFYCLQSPLPDGVLAALLGVHPYAVISTRRDVRVWGAELTAVKSLAVVARDIYATALDLEYKIKSGRVSAERAVVVLSGMFL